MKYLDEQLVMLRSRQIKKKYVNSSTGMYVGEELLHFREIDLPGNVIVQIPENFSRMEPGLAQRKYPSVNRPQVILSNPRGSVSITFSIYEILEEDTSSVADMLDSFKRIIQTAQPSAGFVGRGSQETEGCQRGWLEFKSASLDGGTYNLLTLTRLGRCSVLGMSNCPDSEMLSWRPVLLEVGTTISEKEEKENIQL